MKRSRLGRAAAIGLVSALVVMAGAVFWTARSLNKIHRIDLGGALTASSGGGENFLVVGSDSREAADPSDPDFGSMGDEGDTGGQRSDTIMLVRLEGGKATLLSLPRDLYVPISGTSRTFRLNSAYSRGPDVLVRTVQDALGVPVHHYVEVDFRGFKKLVEAVGGVSVWFDTPVTDRNTGLLIATAGCHRLDGVQALAYTRSRHLTWFDVTRNDWRTDGTGDLGRITRQQDFLRRAMGTAIEEASGNPLRVASIVQAATDNVSVDNGLSSRDLVALGRPLTAVAGGSMETFTFPAAGRVIRGSSVLVPDMSAAEPILARFGAVPNGSGVGRIGGFAARALRLPSQTPSPSQPTVGVVGDRSRSC
jgi:polyisoprenyl-teichoic acid--peptidoglycan teichoic acid transferase